MRSDKRNNAQKVAKMNQKIVKYHKKNKNEGNPASTGQILVSHISDETWNALADDTIHPEAFLEILEHTGQCTWCADRFAKIMEQGNMAILPPAYLKDQIMEHAAQMDVRVPAAVGRASKKIQLLIYGLKVSAAVAMSLFLLGVTSAVPHTIPKLSEQTESSDTFAVLDDSFGLFTVLKESWGTVAYPDEDWQEENELSADHFSDSLLDTMNQAAYAAAYTMNDFASVILNGGKRE